MILRVLTVLSMLSLCLSTQAQSSQTSDRRIHSMDSLLNTYKQTNYPGMAVSVISQGQVILQKALGTANLEYDIPISTSTIFHTASVSKQFTAFAILLLAERGQLSLDNDIRKYIPEVPDFGHTIKLSHLITHTSGLRDQWNLFLLKGVRPDDVITNEHVLQLIAQQQELNFKPGEEYLYCNTGFSLLAEVVARVSGQSFAEFTRENIFLPLNMTSTSFQDDHEKIIRNRAASYYEAERGVLKKRVLNYATVGATNLLSSVNDLSLWTMNFKEQKVGSMAIFKQLQTLATLNNGSSFGGAKGLFIADYKGLREVGHSGADAGFRAHISMFPEQEFTTIVLSNFAGFDTEGIAHRLTDIFLAPTQTSNEVNAALDQKLISLSPKQLKAYEGNYVNRNRGFTRHIYLKGDSLMHFRTENNESALAPLSNTSFKVMNVPPDVVVNFEQVDGEMTMTETVNGGAPRPLEKFDPKPYTVKDWQELEGIYWSPELDTHYVFTYTDGKLIAQHNRMGDIGLEMVKRDFFLGDRGFFQQVDIIRDDQGKITGIKVSNGRVRNLWFEKEVN